MNKMNNKHNKNYIKTDIIRYNLVYLTSIGKGEFILIVLR